ncbi:exported hypothetical protein [Bradyrhizobium sp. ORS 375]|uniref:hypothetical protein n=1 Tax=Bradyrhizobium sp. (strain ORS 375) TaxID=566679 RepID=UPI0002405806|nr:hypothetical protein [Bradyrhizobium sp. ORS 375]CCD92944.1 exported hypothetical protein [Bradyrhizobium sp. ORS 375]
MTRVCFVLLSLLLSGAWSGHADAAGGDRALLSLFCAPKAIAGSTCKQARSYPNANGRRCDVKLGAQRQQGRFVASGKPVLIVSYGSECEPHATDFGGSVLFEQDGGGYVFRGYQPGMQVDECVIAGQADGRDVLVCLTGHMGQGFLETGVARVGFTGSERIEMSYDFLLQASDSTGAYTLNVVTCSEQFKYFGLSKLAAGPRPGTVVAQADYADRETIAKACAKGFPIPKDAQDYQIAPGDAFVPNPYVKSGSVIIDISSRTATLR